MTACTCEAERRSLEANVDRADIPVSAYIRIRQDCPVHRGEARKSAERSTQDDLYGDYEPLSSLDHSKDERDAHRIAWLESELVEARRVIALCAADTTAADLRQEIEFMKAEAERGS